MTEIKRISAGVMFESDVLALIDQLAATQQRNRSFIINAIIRYYARQIAQQAQPTENSADLQNSNLLTTAAEVTKINF